MNRYIYTVDQWVLLFLAYGVCGYIWEVLYVSVRSGKYCNRGFLFGPILPIYGFGAIAILYATIPVRSSLPLVFLLGTASASLLEYATGYVMEKIFKVKYWDYSGDVMNLNGYICLRASFAWGLFSIFLTERVHPFFEYWICSIPVTAAGILAHAGAVLFAADVSLSIKQALDLRALILQFAKENERLGRAAEKIQRIKNVTDAAIAYSDMNRNGIPDVIDEFNDRLREHIAKVLRRNPTATIKHLKSRVEALREEIRQEK